MTGSTIDHCVVRDDISVMQLEVTEGNEPAVSLYHEHGFMPYGLEPMAVLTPTGFKSKIHMWLRLAELQSSAR